VSPFGKLLLVLCIGLALTPGALAQQPPPEPTPTPVAEPPSEPTPPPAPEAPPAPPPAVGSPQSGTYFNPAISVIGNFLAIAGKNRVEDQPSLQLHETEIAFQAIVDPYARADFFISLSNGGVDVEEGFITFTHLPADLLLKVGKFKAQFGKVNTMHAHVLPWADVPLPVVDLLGSEDGWNDAGLSLARIIPLPGDTFSELTAQVFRGKSEGLFEAPSRNALSYLGHYRVYRDIGDDHNVEVGATWGRGHNGVTADSETTLENIHLVYRWLR
jgi:hypothetical protein